MTEREKLIALLTEAEYEGFKICGNHIDCNGCPAFKDGSRCTEGVTADHLIANGVTAQEWISVKDRLPKNAGEHILVCYDDGWVCDQYSPVDGGVTHWMLLPQTPKGENDG